MTLPSEDERDGPTMMRENEQLWQRVGDLEDRLDGQIKAITPLIIETDDGRRYSVVLEVDGQIHIANLTDPDSVPFINTTLDEILENRVEEALR